MDNEKYGIELELITNKFKEKIEQVKRAFKGLQNEEIDLGRKIKIGKVENSSVVLKNLPEISSVALKNFSVWRFSR